jgi:hypothetical protein
MRRPQSSSSPASKAPSSTTTTGSTNSGNSTTTTTMGSGIGVKKRGGGAGGGGHKNGVAPITKSNKNNRINVFARFFLSSSNGTAAGSSSTSSSLRLSLLKSMMFLALGCFSFLLAGYTILSASSNVARQQQQQVVENQSAPASPHAQRFDDQAKEAISQQAAIPSTASSSFSFQRVERIFPPECSIFMAPSSIKSHPGLGIFTTRDIPQGMPFLQAPDGPSIPVVGLDRIPDDNRFRRIVKQFTRMYVTGISDIR